MVETHLIETFVEVVRCGSVTEAARALDRSQPAVSHRLRQLEEAFGTPLFEKVGRELQLTGAGERLVDEAVELLARIRALPGMVSGEELMRGTVTIGAPSTVGRHLLSPALERLIAELPDVKPIIRFGATQTLRTELLAGTIDVIIAVGQLDSHGLDMHRLRDARVAVGLSPTSAPQGRLKLSHLRGLRYLAWNDREDPTYEAIEQWALSRKLVAAATPEIPDLETLRALATTGVGYVVLPEYAMVEDEREGRLRTFAAPGLSRTFPVWLASRRGWLGGAARGRVRDILVEQIAGSGG